MMDIKIDTLFYGSVTFLHLITYVALMTLVFPLEEESLNNLILILCTFLCYSSYTAIFICFGKLHQLKRGNYFQ